MKDMNEIDAGELKAAVTALNKMIDPKIKLIGAKKPAVCEKFKEAVQKFIDEDTVDQLPDVVVDFFNENIADEEEEEVEEVKETKKTSGKKDTKPSGKKDAGKKDAKPAGKGVKNTDGKSAAKKDTEKKERKGRGLSENTRETSIVAALKKGGTKEDLINMSDELYVKAGGESNKAQAKKLLDRAFKYFKAADILTVKGDKYSI